LGEVENPSILKKGRSHPNTLLAAPPAATTIAKRFSPLTQLGHGRAGLDFVAHRQIRKSTNCADPYRDSQRIGLQGLLAALHSALQHSIYSSRSLI
jgi:hypothetical protein